MTDIPLYHSFTSNAEFNPLLMSCQPHMGTVLAHCCTLCYGMVGKWTDLDEDTDKFILSLCDSGRAPNAHIQLDFEKQSEGKFDCLGESYNLSLLCGT